MRILAAIVVLASLSCGPLGAQAGKRCTLSGTVVDGANNRPLAGVTVLLQTEKWELAADSVTSDAQGRFRFSGLSAGEYILLANGSFGTVQFGQTPIPGWVSTLQLGAKGEDKTVEFRILPRASIEGAVRDEFGDPLQTSVSLSRPVWSAGKTILTNVMQKATDDRGFYRFGNLEPGSYVVCAGQDGLPAPVAGPVNFALQPGNRVYTRTCSPSGGATASSMKLAPGQHAQVDIVPLTAAAATVRGRVRNLPPQSGFSVYLDTDDGVSGVRYGSIVDMAQGTFAIRGIQPGRYRLHAMAPGAERKPLSADISLDVSGVDVDGLELSLDTGTSLDVVFRGVGQSSDDALHNLANLRRIDSASNTTLSPRMNAGVLEFAAVSPGTYRLETQAKPDACVASIQLGGRDVRLTTFDMTAGATLHAEVTLTKECGSIALRAMSDGQPVPGAKLVVLLSGTPKAPGEMREDFADDEGGYDLSGLTPGRYLVWAWSMQGKDATAGPASLAEVEKQATIVDVKAGEPVHVDVPVLHEEGAAQ